MLELFGRGYVLEHCISTLKQMSEDEAYRMYTSELLRGIAKSVGCDVRTSYTKLISDMKEPEETRTADEIIGSLKDKIGKIQGET